MLMVRPGFADLPAIKPPPGYSVRSFVHGEREVWLQIVRAAFEDPTWSETRFELFMVEHAGYAEDRIYFVCDPDGRACATASAFRAVRSRC